MPQKTHALTDAEMAEGLLPLVTVGDAILSLPTPPSTTIANHVGRVHGQAVTGGTALPTWRIGCRLVPENAQ